MSHIYPVSTTFLNPRAGFELMKSAQVLAAIPMDFLLAKFMNHWSIPSDIPDFDTFPHTLTPGVSASSSGVADTINDLIIISPDSPLFPDIDIPLAPQTATGQFLGMLTGIATKVKGLLPLIPPFLYELINSEEKLLQNIKVEITATSKKKVYEIEFGKLDGEGVAIALEVVAGQPIKLLHDRNAAQQIDHEINAVFPITSIFNRIWKRQEPHTECIITVKDPGNYLLKDKQIMQFIPLSKHEGFKIVHQDPTVIRNPFGKDHTAYDYYEPAEDSEYASLSSVTVKLDKPMPLSENKRSELFPLPFSDDPKKARDYYLEITQYQ